MGIKYRFICKNCKYTAQVSGGLDYGIIAVIKTKVCDNCLELVDVLVGNTTENEKNIGYIPDFEKCPECGNSDLFDWYECLCPRCGEKMEKDCRNIIFWD